MQRSLNMIDSKDRSKNVIITGVRETELVIQHEGEEPDTTLSNDEEKVSWILKLIDCHHFDGDGLQDLNITRIGKEREGFNRLIKVETKSSEDRNEFLKNSGKLKDAGEMWKKVYLKKDEHPVYLGEKNRLRQKMNNLRRKPENENKTILIQNGKLTIDGNVEDQNLFFP